MAATEKFEVVNISLTPTIAQFLKRSAAEADRTVSAHVRHLVRDEARRLGVDLSNGRPAPPPPPPPLVEPTTEAVAEARARLAGMQTECRRLRKIIGDPNGEWSVTTEARYLELQAQTNRLKFEIERAEERIVPPTSA
jgi:hypothetical protein